MMTTLKKQLLWNFAFVFASAKVVLGQDLIIQARVALANGDPQYVERDGNWQNSSVQSSAPGTTAGVGSRFNTRAGSSIQLLPALKAGGVYYLEAAFPAPGSQTADIVCRIDLVGCTLTNFNTNTYVNTQNSTIETFAFRRAGGTSWRRIGQLIVDPGAAAPEIAFVHVGGDISSATTSRFYSDAYRFVDASDPCLSGLPLLTTVNGPLAAGQAFVDVPAVATNATKITVYANGVQIGQKTTGIAGGTNIETVVTSPLVKGQVIAVTQHNANNVESCRPTTGPIVGGGPNAPVRVSYSLRMDANLAGPVGAEGTSSSSWLVMLGATGPTSGFGTAPAGGVVLQPGTCWQTLAYDFNVDNSYTWNGSGGDGGTFAILDSIAFSMEDPFDAGPYAIYIDNIRNGETLIEDFEGQTNGTAGYLFTLPNFSGSTSGNLLSPAPGSVTPNISVVTNSNADTGLNSAFINWQFKDVAPGSWLRLPLAGTGKRNPQVDLSKPISIRFLVLPVGATNSNLQLSSIGHQTNAIGDNVTLSVSVLKGAGPFTYQWRSNGVSIAGATNNTLQINNAQTTASGAYSVVVNGPTCSSESFGTLTVTQGAPAPRLTYSVNGKTLTLSWTDTQAVLQTATALTGSASDWTDVPNASSPHAVDTSTGTRFFRLKR